MTIAIVQDDSATYEVEMKVAETEAYRLYICKDVASGAEYLLQIASDIGRNGELEKAAFILKKLAQTAADYEAKNTELGGEKPLSYDRLFPRLVSGFVYDRRRANILAFTDVKGVRSLVPVSNIADRDKQRISLMSSAWIMGRLIKLLAFAHDWGIEVKALGRNNILLEPSSHIALVFDWSSAWMYPDEKVPTDKRKDDIGKAAQAVFQAIGGDVSTGTYSYPFDKPEERRYIEALWRFACRREHNADRALDYFYKVVEELWGRKFRKFTTLPL